MIVKGRLKATRALLSWTQADLAEAANVSREPINDFESGKRTPIPNNRAAIFRVLESAGIQFIGEGRVELGSNRQ
jgi:transcriptional regulator with XRE-family HTH domain